MLVYCRMWRKRGTQRWVPRQEVINGPNNMCRLTRNLPVSLYVTSSSWRAIPPVMYMVYSLNLLQQSCQWLLALWVINSYFTYMLFILRYLLPSVNNDITDGRLYMNFCAFLCSFQTLHIHKQAIIQSSILIKVQRFNRNRFVYLWLTRKWECTQPNTCTKRIRRELNLVC